MSISFARTSIRVGGSSSKIVIVSGLAIGGSFAGVTVIVTLAESLPPFP